MTSMVSWARSHPVATAGLVVLFYLAWFCAPALLSGQEVGQGNTPEGVAGMVGQLLPEIGLAVSVLLVAWIIGDPKGLHLTSPLARRWGWVVLLPGLYVGTLFALSVSILQSDAAPPGAAAAAWTALAPLVATTLLVGVFEETLFRGIVFRALTLWRGPLIAFVGSSALFGAMHYVNWVGGQSLSATHLQVLHAGLSGLLYCSIMLMTGSIWPAVLYHGLWDFTITFFQTASGATATVDAAAAGATAQGGDAFIQGVIFGFEPVLGVILFAIWWRTRRKGRAATGG